MNAIAVSKDGVIKLLKGLNPSKALRPDELHPRVLKELRVCVCEFGFNVAFNNFSVISRRCLVATGSSMLTFIVLPH